MHIRKLISLALLVGALLSLSAAGEAFYIAQAATGGNTGADCADAHAYTFFNTLANWANPKVAGQIGPGDTVHFCGTITTFNGTTYDFLAVKASGLSGSPITILWESGAKVSVPAPPSGGAILNTVGKNFLVIDGGTNGIIEATANGSALANQVNNAYAIWDGNNGCTSCEVKNLTIQNIYVHSSPADNNGSNGIHLSGTGLLMHNMVCHDAADCFATNNEATMYNLTAYNVNHCFTIGNSGISQTIDHAIIHDSTCYNYANWDTTANTFHHDGAFVFGTAGVTITTVQIYNNLFYGTVGVNATSDIFVAGGTGGITNAQAFNNVSIHDSGTSMANGLIAFGPQGNIGTILIANNTVIGGTTSAGVCYVLAATTATVENNIGSNCANLVTVATGMPTTGLDYNTYGPGSASNSWKLGSTFYSTLAAWQTATAAESHSTSNASVGTGADGRLQPGAPAIGAGLNLTSLAITALDSDKAGVARPAVLAWDVGAYQFVTAASPNRVHTFAGQ